MDTQSLTMAALKAALRHRRPRIHHADQGWQYACREYVDLLRQHGVLISMASVGEPRENGSAERLMGYLTPEEFAYHYHEQQPTVVH